MVACFANNVSMWSKNAIPVLMEDFPLPSRLRRTEILVSLVWREIFACRTFMVMIKPKRAAKNKPQSLAGFGCGRLRLAGHFLFHVINPPLQVVRRLRGFLSGLQ